MFKTYALTINNVELVSQLKSIDKVFSYLDGLGFHVYLISTERNELNNNIHYHILADFNDLDNLVIDLKIWFKELTNKLEILKYIDYVKKDGRFKIYNKHDFETDVKLWYDELISLIFEFESPKDLLIEHPKFLSKVFMIDKLFDILKP